MKKYEYMVKQLQMNFTSVFSFDRIRYNEETEEKLNEYGKDGWELAGVDGTWFYFKREL